jgi:hypothetical protein
MPLGIVSKDIARSILLFYVLIPPPTNGEGINGADNLVYHVARGNGDHGYGKNGYGNGTLLSLIG